MSKLELKESATYLLAKLAIAHKNLLEKKMGEVGLHSGQAFVLFALWEQDGLRQIDLAEALNVSPPTVNKTVGGLCKADLVTRKRYDDDARSTRIFLTDAGRSIRGAVDANWREIEEHISMDLTETERLILPQLLVKILGNYLNR